MRRQSVPGWIERARTLLYPGVDDPYEEPENPELVLETDRESVEESIQKVLDMLRERRYMK